MLKKNCWLCNKKVGTSSTASTSETVKNAFLFVFISSFGVCIWSVYRKWTVASFKNVLKQNLLELTLPAPFISESCNEIKIKLNLCFGTSLWCLKRFYEGLKGLHKTFWGTAKRCENKNLTFSGVETLEGLVKRRSKAHENNMSRELALNFETNEKHFTKTISQ